MKHLLTLSAIIMLAMPHIALAQFDVGESDTEKPVQQIQTQPQPPIQPQPTYRSQQFKKNYFEIDIGIFLQSGGNDDEYRRLSRAQAVDIFAKNDEDGLNADDVRASFDEFGYFRMALGTHISQQFAFEFASTGIVIDTSRSFGDGVDNSLDNSFGDFNNYSVNIIEFAGIYYIPVSDKFKFTLRAGFGFYEWFDKNSEPLPEHEDAQQFSGDTPLLGIGADISNVHLEYRQYNLTAIDVYKGEKYQLYDSVGVFTIGYKFRF